MDLPCTRRVEPVRQSPRTKMYGYFTIELFHLPALTHLARCRFPTAFAGRLPRPTLVAACAVTRLSPRFRYFCSHPTTDRASLAISLALIGLLTPVPPGDSVSPPEVTHCSSVPCHPQTPWCGG